MATSSKQFKTDESEITSISRSGRLCKKSSKLMYFDSAKSNINNKKKNNISKRYKKLKQSQNKENINLQNQSHISYDSYFAGNYKKKSKVQQRKISAINQLLGNKIKNVTSYEMLEPNKSETESDSIQSINGLQTPDYTSYDEESLYSDEEFLISKSMAPISEPKKVFFSNLMNETKMDIISKDSVCTGYKLWSAQMKKEILKKYSSIDITIMTIRLGEMWSKMSVRDRNNWHNRAQHLTEKHQLLQNKFIIDHEHQNWLKSCTSSEEKFQIRQLHSNIKLINIQLQPINVAAYLKLLAESLILISSSLQQHNKSIIMSNSITVLLDSLLCAMASLICLTQQISIVKINNFITFLRTLENIAYIMPGL